MKHPFLIEHDILLKSIVSSNNCFCFFSKGWRTSKTLQEIISIITKFAGPATNIKEHSLHNPAGFWSNVCKDLQVPNTLTNHQKIQGNLSIV